MNLIKNILLFLKNWNFLSLLSIFGLFFYFFCIVTFCQINVSDIKKVLKIKQTNKKTIIFTLYIIYIKKSVLFNLI